MSKYNYPKQRHLHCIKHVRIRSYSGPYSVRMRENTDENNSEYGLFSRSVDRQIGKLENRIENIPAELLNKTLVLDILNYTYS